jgi:hypothetical protein
LDFTSAFTTGKSKKTFVMSPFSGADELGANFKKKIK